MKKYLDAVNTAAARVQQIAAQIDALFDEGKTDEAVALRPELDGAKAKYDQANQLYLSMLNAVPSGSDPAQRFAPAGGNVQVTLDAADQPFESDGQFFMAVKNAALYPARTDVRLHSRRVVDATGMSEGVPEDGGYLLSPQRNNSMIERMYNTGQILSRLTVDPIGANSNSITYNAVDETSRVAGSRNGGVRGYWVAEAGTITSSKPKFRQFEVKPKKVAALCYATDEQLRDITNLEAWLNRVVPDELRFLVEDAIFEGDGVGKPLGILNSPCLISLTRADAGKILFADIVGMWARRWPGVSDYVWFVSQDSTPQLDAMVIGTEAPPRFVDYGPEGTLRIKGRPVIEVEYAATLGDPGDIVLASLSQYQAGDIGGVQSASSIHVQFVTDETAFRFTYRIDGQPSWSSALTPFHGSNTVSPFVCCASAS